MGTISNIQWTDATWNIARGCSKVDEDCKFCYMYRDSMNDTRYNPREVVRTKTVFDLPMKLKEPSRIFTCSLTDFFHEEIDSYRDEAWEIIRKCPQHTFQILTKRPDRIIAHLPKFQDKISNHVWLGTSVGSQEGHRRLTQLSLIKSLFGKNCPILFLSAEPLHGELKIYPIKALDWVIIGGESGNENGKYRYRPCKLEWIENIIKQCQDNSIPVFVKQLGTHLAKELKLSDRHGGNIDEWPEHLRIREFPM